MQISNNNQTTFGMNSVTANGSARFVRRIEGMKPEIMKIGGAGCNCTITQGKWWQFGRKSIIVTDSRGAVKEEISKTAFTNGTILDLIKTVHEKWTNSLHSFAQTIMR